MVDQQGGANKALFDPQANLPYMKYLPPFWTDTWSTYRNSELYLYVPLSHWLALDSSDARSIT